jgi:hypothetical protein
VSSYTATTGIITGDCTVSATFAIKTYTITASYGANGAISPSGSVLVNHGSDQGFTITPDVHYQVADVMVDGVSVGGLLNYTFVSVTESHNIEASFTDKYNLSVILKGSGKGTITSSPAGIDCNTDCDENYSYGTEVILTPTPTGTSKFAGWSGDVDCTDGTVTITGDITCDATFISFPWPMFLPGITKNAQH